MLTVMGGLVNGQLTESIFDSTNGDQVLRRALIAYKNGVKGIMLDQKFL